MARSLWGQAMTENGYDAMRESLRLAKAALGEAYVSILAGRKDAAAHAVNEATSHIEQAEDAI